MISALIYSISYIMVACCIAIIRPLPFKLFGWRLNDENEVGWTVGSIFWPALICILIVMIPVRGVASLRGKFEDYLYNHSQRKLLKAEKAKREVKEVKKLAAPNPVGYKEVFYRDMNCTQCGHTVSVPR